MVISCRGDHKGIITSCIWAHEAVAFTTSTMLVEYITCNSKVSRPICSLHTDSYSSGKLVHMTNDRIVYSVGRKDGLSSLMVRPFLPLEVLILGLLESSSSSNDSDEKKELLRQCVHRYGSRFTPNSNNEGLIPDSGITLTVIEALLHHGFPEVAYYLARSAESVGIFLQRPQIASLVKSLLAVRLGHWDEALVELLCEDPSLLEYANNPGSSGCQLPPPHSTLAIALKRLGMIKDECHVYFRIMSSGLTLSCFIYAITR